MAGCAAFALSVSPQALAAGGESAGGGWVAFRIPAQPLADALNAYGETTHIPMFVDSELTAGRRSSEIVGVLSPFDALTGLLAGTGLTVKSVGNAGFTLAPLRRADPGTAIPGGSPAAGAALAFDGYSAEIQTALHELLCRHQETRPGTFRALVRLWIGATGRIVRSDVLTPSGDGQRDRMLAAGLRDLAIGQPPPPDLPQPVTLLLLPTTLAAADYCPLAPVEQRQVDRR